MRFTEHCPVPLRRGLQLMLAVALLCGAGCQFMPAKQRETATPAPAPVTADVNKTKSGAGAVQRAPNPYLLNRPVVPSAARRRFAAATIAMKEQQWQLAETDLLWLTVHYPQFSGPYLDLALLYQQSGQPDKVEPAFQQAIATNANNVVAYNQYAIYLRGQGRFAKAEALYLRALKVWPDSAQTHLNLGILYDLYMGKLDRALAQYQAYQALQDRPDHRVQGWIVDTERRLAKPQGGSGGDS